MKFNFKVVMVLVAFVLFISSHQASAATVFKDINSTHAQYNEITYLVNKGVINGIQKPDGVYYDPDSSVTRAQVAKMVVIAKGYEPLTVTKSSFSDVPMDVMTGYIEKATQLGYMIGVGNGQFNPNAPIRREDMSKVLVNAFNINSDAYKDTPVPFTDVNKNITNYPYIAALFYNGITNGIGNNLYGMDQSVTRGAFAAFMARVMDSKFTLPKPTVEEVTAVARVYVTTNDLNVRATANANGQILGKVNTGDKLWAYSINGNWIEVSYNGKKAYISSSYAKFIDTEGLTFNLSSATNKALTSAATVYRGTNTSSKIITTLPVGTQVPVYGTKGDWSIVTVNGIPGYILTSATVQNVVSNTNTVGRVTTNSLNIRQSASSNSDIIGSLPLNAIVSVNSISNWWANITYNGVTGYVHKTYLHLMNKTGSSVKDRIIVLDPGHGGTDPGAVNGSYTEKAVVLDVAKRVQALLEQAGAKVVLTRSTDVFIPLNDRPTIALNNYADMFISIHTNSFTTGSPKGTETYYNDSSSTNLQEEKNLATLINNQIVSNLGMTNRGVLDANFAVTRPLDMPAILVELGFISNASDLEKLKSDYHKQLFAQSIYNGIESYYRYK